MNFTSFVSMLEHGGLYFCRVDKLGDPWEAAIPKRWLEKAEIARAEFAEQGIRGTDLITSSIEMVDKQRPWTMVNCWHMNEHESAAMWKLYCTAADGVCVRSKYALLDECLEEHVYLGQVTYISYETDSIPVGNLFWPFMYKRRSFEHEREVRALICDVQRAVGTADNPPQNGEWRSVCLDRLIEAVYIAPTGPDWVVELVREIQKRYGLRKPVHHSSLFAEPIR